jgi:hypothetical protein
LAKVPRNDPGNTFSPLAWGARGLGYKLGGPLGGMMAEEVIRANPVRLAALARGGRVVQEYISDSMGRMLSGGVRGSAALKLDRVIAPTTLGIERATTPRERRDALNARMEELASMGEQGVADRAAAETAHLDADAPDAAQAVRNRAVSMAGYLLARAPRPLVQNNPMVPRGPSYNRVSDADALAFAQLDRALQDPLSVMDALGNGKVPSPQVLAAVRDNYPGLWSQAEAAFQHHLAERPEDVPWETVLRAGIVFGANSHPALQPSNLATQQRLIQPPAAGPGRPRKGAPPKDGVNVAVSPLDRIAEEGKLK